MAGFHLSNGQLRANSPTSMIPVVQDIKGIDNIHTIMKIRDFVFSIVPWFLKPSIGLNINVENIAELYKLFSTRKAGGWCGLNADYFQMLLYWFQIKTYPYNFGIKSRNISHVGLIVEYDGEEFFMDPYFAVHYIHRDGFLLTFRHLMTLIAERKLDHIVPVYSEVRKPVQQEDGTFLMMTPQEIHKSIIIAWSEGTKSGTDGFQYEKTMMDIFGQTDPLLLMLIKIVG